jgi:hypothetical protein
VGVATTNNMHMCIYTYTYIHVPLSHSTFFLFILFTCAERLRGLEPIEVACRLLLLRRERLDLHVCMYVCWGGRNESNKAPPPPKAHPLIAAQPRTSRMFLTTSRAAPFSFARAWPSRSTVRVNRRPNRAYSQHIICDFVTCVWGCVSGSVDVRSPPPSHNRHTHTHTDTPTYRN